VVSDTLAVTSYRSHYKLLGVCYGFTAVFSIFGYPSVGGRGALKRVDDGTVG